MAEGDEESDDGDTLDESLRESTGTVQEDHGLTITSPSDSLDQMGSQEGVADARHHRAVSIQAGSTEDILSAISNTGFDQDLTFSDDDEKRGDVAARDCAEHSSRDQLQGFGPLPPSSFLRVGEDGKLRPQSKDSWTDQQIINMQEYVVFKILSCQC